MDIGPRIKTYTIEPLEVAGERPAGPAPEHAPASEPAAMPT